MKTRYFSKTALLAALPIGCVAGFGFLTAQAEEDYNGTVTLGAGGAFIDGDRAALQQRLGQNGDFYGGISEFGYEREVGDVLWTLDGQAMYGNTAFMAILRGEKDGLGYLEVGYHQYTTFYDGSGGYLPTAVPSLYPLADDDLELERGSVWFEAGLRVEDIPEVTFRYTHVWRDGEKDSTMWSRPGSFAYEDTLYMTDETRDIFELDIAHTLGNTDLALGFRYEMMDNLNDRVYDRGGEVLTEGFESDLFNVHASSVTRFNEQMMLSFGYSFTTLDVDSYFKLTGSVLGSNGSGAEQDTNVVNASFWWNPIEDLVVVPSIRAEWNDGDAMSQFWYDGYGGDGYARPMVDVEGNTLTEQLDIRYTGIDNLVLYTKLTFEQEQEDTDWLYYQQIDGTFDPLEIPVYALSGYRYKECDASRMKASIGANWYAMKGLSFSAQYNYKLTDLDYDTDVSGTGLTHFGDAHIGSLDMETNDINLRMTWRPLSRLTLVTRYDWQTTEYNTVGFDGSLTRLPEVQAGDYECSSLSQSVTYLIRDDLYLQGSVGIIWSETETAGSSGGAAYVGTAENDYLTASLSMGWAIDEKTDITAGYSYYLAENFSVPASSVGYGTDLEEHVFSLGINRQLTENMLLNVGYAYYKSMDGDSGGQNDFDAHILSSGLQIRF